MLRRSILRTLSLSSPHISKAFSSLKYSWVTLPIPEAILKHSQTIRIMSYNILANCNIYPRLYPKVSPEHLEWDHRQPLIIKNIEDLSPDIACIQEFEPLISQSMMQYMENSHYKFDFKGKTGNKSEGCLTFWRSSMFELLFSFHVDMNFVDRLKELSFLDKDNIAQIVVLKSKMSNEVFIIANTHLIYNMGRGELKLGQTLILLKSLNEVISLCDKLGYKNRSTFICGDFNSVPNSLLYNVFSEPNFSLFDIPSGQISNQIYAKYLNSADDLKHYTETTRKFVVTPSRLKSKFPVLEEKFIEILKGVKAAVAHNQGGFEFTVDVQDRKERIVNKPFSRAEFGIDNTFFHSTYAFVNKTYYHQRPDDKSTNINKLISKIKEQLPLFKIERLTFESAMSHISADFKANVDYIWSNLNNQFKPFRILEIMDYDQLRLNRHYPNHHHPTDHLPLVADFYKKD